MKTKISTLLILCIAFFFSACQVAEQEDFVYEAKEYTGAEYLANYRTPSAMFLVAITNNETDKRNGFIIDNQGNLKKLESVSFAATPENATVHPGSLQNMIDHGETVRQIDLDELVGQFKKIRLAARARTLTGEADPSAAFNYEFYGYTLGVPGYSGGNAGCQGPPSSSEYFSQFLLKSEGLEASFLNSGNATEIVDWLKGLNESVK